MKRNKEKQLNAEQIQLFESLWKKLCEDHDKIMSDFTMAENLACSNWQNTHLGLSPTKLHPEDASLLEVNLNLFIEHNSRQKYFLIMAFLPTLKRLKRKLTTDQKAVYEYWNKELKKSDPELENRFAKS